MYVIPGLCHRWRKVLMYKDGEFSNPIMSDGHLHSPTLKWLFALSYLLHVAKESQLALPSEVKTKVYTRKLTSIKKLTSIILCREMSSTRPSSVHSVEMRYGNRIFRTVKCAKCAKCAK